MFPWSQEKSSCWFHMPLSQLPLHSRPCHGIWSKQHEVWEHPQLKARERWREVGSPEGPLPAMLPPGSWNEGPRMDPVPALGEHTDAILAELGIEGDAVQALRAAEAI